MPPSPSVSLLACHAVRLCIIPQKAFVAPASLTLSHPSPQVPSLPFASTGPPRNSLLIKLSPRDICCLMSHFSAPPQPPPHVAQITPRLFSISLSPLIYTVETRHPSSPSPPLTFPLLYGYRLSCFFFFHPSSDTLPRFTTPPAPPPSNTKSPTQPRALTKSAPVLS